MQDGDGPMGGEHRVQARGVTNIAHFQRSPLDVLAVAVRQVVEHDGPKTRLGQGQTGVRTDIAGSAGHQNGLHPCSRAKMGFC